VARRLDESLIDLVGFVKAARRFEGLSETEFGREAVGRVA
jgi:hypothetical protein